MVTVVLFPFVFPTFTAATVPSVDFAVILFDAFPFVFTVTLTFFDEPASMLTDVFETVIDFTYALAAIGRIGTAVKSNASSTPNTIIPEKILFLSISVLLLFRDIPQFFRLTLL